VERQGQIHDVGDLAPDTYFYRMTRRIADLEGKEIGAEDPQIKLGLPDGSRFTAAIPPLSREGTAINIRRFGRKKLFFITLTVYLIASGAAALTWNPVLVFASSNDVLGYSIGNSIYRPKGKDDPTVSAGHYLSVWMRQANGEYRAVLDTGISHEAPASAPTGWGCGTGSPRPCGRGRGGRVGRESPQRAAAAWKAGKFDNELVPVSVPQKKGDPIIFKQDEGVRGDATAQSGTGHRSAAFTTSVGRTAS